MAVALLVWVTLNWSGPPILFHVVRGGVSATAGRVAGATSPGDCAAIHRDLKSRKNLTLQLLWEEYKQANPLGYAYNWYCVLYRAWQHRLDVVMRQEHRAGEKTFVDHAGQTVPVTDPKTGRVRQAAVFVALLGASSYTYAEAT